MRTLDKNLQPEDAIVTTERPEIALEFDTRTDKNAVRTRNLAGGQITETQIADGAVTSAKIAQLTIATGDIANGAVTSTKIAGTISDKLITGGTVGTAVIGTSQITGGSIGISVGTLNNMIMGTPNITGGTLANGIVGTCQLTGGTTTPSVYMHGTAIGISTSISYLNASTVAHTATFTGGILTGNA